jgi:hypothetical protein
MTRYYRRIDAGSGENLRAGLVASALAVTAAAVSFYIVRIFLCREPLPELPREGQGAPIGTEGEGK